MSLLEIVGGSEKNRLFIGRLLAGWLWKEPVLMQKMLKVASLGLHTRSESHLPLVDCVVD